MRKLITTLVLLILAAMFAAPVTAQEPAVTAVTVDIDNLQPLGPDYVYEGWIIVDGQPVSTGRFSVSDDGSLSQRRFPVEVDGTVGAFVLTIEPARGDDPAPSAVHLVGGDFGDGVAQLTTDHPAALGSDFRSAAGSYILAVPTGTVDCQYIQGIWWLDPRGDGPSPSLQLPELPDGWTYEGWVVGPDGPVSTGRFDSVRGADSDGAGPAAGDGGAPPPFPGQDFVEPAMYLTTEYAAVITIEPEPDTSPAPFSLKPLVDGTVDQVGAKVPQAMENKAGGFPTGVARLERTQTQDDGTDSMDSMSNDQASADASQQEQKDAVAQANKEPTDNEAVTTSAASAEMADEDSFMPPLAAAGGIGAVLLMLIGGAAYVLRNAEIEIG